MSRHNSKYHKRIRSKHHIINKVNDGPSTPENIILLRMEKHRAWHQLFHNMSFLQVAELLIRTNEVIKKKGVRR